MNRFWDSIIKPIFDKIEPKLIIEIGSDVGLNTKKILSYCSAVGNAKLISIDPSPSFDVESIKNEYDKFFIPIKDLSLNSLKTLENYDVILIDGDHNWYTVYNELKIIENKFNQNNFPLIFFHDISWPYGRRDLYYNPDTIPLEYLHKYEKLGMVPSQKKLLEIGGINTNLNNANDENTPKNGVLTAIEDFLNQTSLNLTFYKINGFNGLGIMFPKNKLLYTFIQKIVYESEIGEVVEKFYLEEIVNKNILLNDIKNQLQNLVKVNLQQKNQITELNRKNFNYKIQIQNLIRTNEKYSDDLKDITDSHDQLITQFNDVIVENNGNKSQIINLTHKIQMQKSKIKTLTEANKNYQTQIQNLIKTNSKYQSQIKILNDANYTYKNTINSFKNNNNNNLIINNKVLAMNNEELISDKHSLLEENSNLSNRNNELNKINRDLKIRLTKCNDIENKNNATIQVLNEKKGDLINEINQLKQIINDMESSNSWKITKPFRKLKF